MSKDLLLKVNKLQNRYVTINRQLFNFYIMP